MECHTVSAVQEVSAHPWLHIAIAQLTDGIIVFPPQTDVLKAEPSSHASCEQIVIGAGEEDDCVVGRLRRGEVNRHERVIGLVTTVIDGGLTHLEDKWVSIAFDELTGSALDKHAIEALLDHDEPDVSTHLSISEGVLVGLDSHIQ